MKKKLLLIIASFSLLGLVSCSSSENNSKSEDNIQNKQFEIISEETLGQNTFIIIKHKETGKRFIVFTGYYKGGIAPLD